MTTNKSMPKEMIELHKKAHDLRLMFRTCNTKGLDNIIYDLSPECKNGETFLFHGIKFRASRQKIAVIIPWIEKNYMAMIFETNEYIMPDALIKKCSQKIK